MGNLKGKICLVAGGAGTVGEGVVTAFLKQGATVLVPSRSQERLDGLRAFVGPLLSERLELLVGNLGEPEEAARLREQILARWGAVHAVVASLGGSWEERLPLLKVPMATFRAYQDNNFNAHLITAQTFLPVLMRQAGSSYTLLGGLSALVPVPLYSPVAVNSAAQLMLAKLLMTELKDAGVRINQVMCGYVHTRARSAYAKPEWITAEEVGEFAAYLASDAGRMISGGVLQLGDRPAPPAERSAVHAGTDSTPRKQ